MKAFGEFDIKQTKKQINRHSITVEEGCTEIISGDAPVMQRYSYRKALQLLVFQLFAPPPLNSISNYFYNTTSVVSHQLIHFFSKFVTPKKYF